MYEKPPIFENSFHGFTVTCDECGYTADIVDRGYFDINTGNTRPKAVTIYARCTHCESISPVYVIWDDGK